MPCPHCKSPDATVVKAGFFSKRSTRAERIQRFLCRRCHRRFSTQTGALTYRERKPHVDQELARLLAKGMSHADAAEHLGIHKVTVARKLCRLGLRAAELHLADVANQGGSKVVVFDEMETFEHTKCKPLSIALAVEHRSRRIIAVRVASMPAKGRLAAISRQKYGLRPDERRRALDAMARAVRVACPNLTELRSDQCPRYPAVVRSHFPGVGHVRFKGRRPIATGYGELKQGRRDPLWALNHTCARSRDKVKRLARRTWCTTKRADRLQLVLNIFAWFHNQRINGVGRLAQIPTGMTN